MTIIKVYDEVIGSIITNHSMTVDEIIEAACTNVKINNPDETGDYGEYALYDENGSYRYSFNAEDVVMEESR